MKKEMKMNVKWSDLPWWFWLGVLFGVDPIRMLFYMGIDYTD